jgi:hypothetical protein
MSKYLCLFRSTASIRRGILALFVKAKALVKSFLARGWFIIITEEMNCDKRKSSDIYPVIKSFKKQPAVPLPRIKQPALT